MQYSSATKWWAALGLLWAATAHAQTPALIQPDELLPTRMVLCQREVDSGARDRADKLRTCLARRLEGERVVERDCKRQSGGVSGNAARAQAQRACERQALGVPSTELPRRPPPPPRPKPEPDAVPAVPLSSMPAAGEQ
ncbi:hypothetical protein [Ottowia testudinis]|uniref:PsiF repeat-containing protein n=1 Tax=Ottowia testudinis TaxID=2816950 RepID=A0A975H3R8_9BURK|nr:hypothetical protein [Ottowia testudinis]QTD45541.1 hypothetical protein J1M35_01015 [Ottowia testudinis]